MWEQLYFCSRVFQFAQMAWGRKEEEPERELSNARDVNKLQEKKRCSQMGKTIQNVDDKAKSCNGQVSDFFLFGQRMEEIQDDADRFHLQFVL